MRQYTLMNRRQFIKHSTVLAGSMYLAGQFNLQAQNSGLPKPRLAVTIDDPNLFQTPLYEPRERDLKILENLAKHNLKAALFVCGEKTDPPAGRKLLQRWDSSGHLICNHSYSHHYYHSSKIDINTYLDDIARCDQIINKYDNYTKLFRYPYLKEGNTIEKRDTARAYLKTHDYSHGYVSIDASDWYIDQRLNKRLKENKSADISAYYDFYIQHIQERAAYYSGLAAKFYSKPINHTLLIHHNLLNALFLDQLLTNLKSSGWDLIDADKAFTDPIYLNEPDILPAGESIIWALAKETGRFDAILRYPGEDSQYEEQKIIELGL